MIYIERDREVILSPAESLTIILDGASFDVQVNGNGTAVLREKSGEVLSDDVDLTTYALAARDDFGL